MRVLACDDQGDLNAAAQQVQLIGKGEFMRVLFSGVHRPGWNCWVYVGCDATITALTLYGETDDFRIADHL